MKAMILAAGKGVRMRPLTDHMPKPLLSVKGKSLLEYHLESLAKANIKDIVINVSYLGEKIQQALGNGAKYGVNIQYSLEAEPLETGGGIFNALPLLGKDPFIVISGDICTDFPFEKLPKKIAGLAHLVLNDCQAYQKQGDFCLIQDMVIAHGVNKLNFAGIAIYHPNLFQGCKPGIYSIAPLLVKAMQCGLVSGEYYSGKWSNVGTPDVLASLNKS